MTTGEVTPVVACGDGAGEDEVFVFPATAAQGRFWLLDQLVPGGNPALNMTLAVALRGTLDAAALERALDALVERHESLRTTFQYEGGGLRQLVAPVLGLRMARVDVRDFPATERAGVPAHLADEEAARPFDLARGPLCRALLVCLSPVEHTLLLTLHHVICDGWSLGILLRELAALYAAGVQGEASPLPPPGLQFADFAEWQQDRATGGGYEPDLAYWRERLGGTLPVLDLPADRPPGPSVRARVAPAGTRWRTVPGPLAASLKGLAAREGASAYMLYLAVFAALLSRYDANGGEDILVGTPSANRARAEIEGTVGLFVNPLLLRLDLAGQPAFGKLLARVRRSVLGAFEHAEAPFERVIEELESRRLQVNFQYAKTPLRLIRAGGVELLPQDPPSGGAMYEWDATVIEDEHSTRVGIEYDAGLFDAATVDRALADYEILLMAIAAPDGTLADPWRLTLTAPPGKTLRAARWQMPPSSGAWASPFLEASAPGGALRIVDRHDGTVPVGVPGEILVDGKRTGDLGRRTPDGAVEWLGSLGAQARANGQRLDARSVEAALRMHPHIREALVRGRTAWFQSDGAPAALVSPEQLRAFLRERLPEGWVPTAFAAVERFPTTAEGWLDEARLPAATDVPANDPAAGGETPYLTIHFQLIDLWQEILRVPRVGIHDDFFALGGNSLLAMRMLARVEELSGKKVLPATLFRQATVEGLADAVLQRGGDGPPPELIAVQERGPRTPIFYLHGDMTGGGYYCLKLSRRLGDEQPFYALPPAEVADWRELPEIEVLAARHVRAIRAVRSHGPYIVGGFCLAGLIALEVTRQLTAAGEAVERLFLVDATARNRRSKRLRRAAERLGRLRGWDASRRLYHFCRWHFLLERLARWKKMGVAGQFGVVRRRLARVTRRLRRSPEPETLVAANPAADLAPRDRGGSAEDGSWFDPRWDVPLVFLWAEGGYEAGKFEGPATLLLSHDLTGSAAGEPVECEWAKRLPQLEIRLLAGSHLGSITEHVDGLAETLRAALAKD